MNTSRATNLTPVTEACRTASTDGSAWTRAGQVWRSRQAAGAGQTPPEFRSGRTALVNSVLGALKKFDCGLYDDSDVAGALHDAVRRFNQRTA